MPRYLTQEWLDQAKELSAEFPERQGASARMQFVVTDVPGQGEVRYYWVVSDGKLVEAQLGDDPDADFTITQTYDVATNIQTGEMDPNTAFMQGRMKVTGNMGKLMTLMPLTQSQEYKEIQSKINEVTEYPE